MATMQLNKEVILKHKFWIVLLVFLLLWIAAMTIQAMASGSVEEKRKAYEKAKKEVEDANKKRPKNDQFLEPWRVYAKAYSDQKETVWKDAWDLQKEMITWPNSVTAPFQERWDTSPTLADFLKRVAEISDPKAKGWVSGLARNEFKDTLYMEQFKELEKNPVKPVELSGGIDGIFQPVSWQPDKPPLIEELWLAQEDFWVHKEMLGIIRAAVDALAQFERFQPKEKQPLPAGALARHQFHNSTWELDILIQQKGRQLVIDPRSQIKNIHPNKRIMKLANPRTNKGLAFQLIQGSSKFPFRIEGEPLAAGQSAPFQKEIAPETIRLNQPFEVEQVFDWDSCPIKRIDALQLAYHSHRTANLPLKANDALSVADPKDAGPAGAGGMGGAGAMGGAAGAPGGMPGAGGGPAGGMGAEGERGMGRMGMGGMAGGGDSTPSGLRRDRYITLTEQCRHMPVAFLVVVDQAHIHDVLIAVANSKLRIQITQVEFNHAHGVAPPPDEDLPEGSRDRPPAIAAAPRSNAAFRATDPRMEGRMGRGGFMMGRDARLGKDAGAVRRAAVPRVPGIPGVPGVPQGAATVSTFEGEDSNLVELAVYGIATLYERFPENRTPEGGAPGTSPAGTPPAGAALNPAGTAPAGPVTTTPPATTTPMPPAGQPAPAAGQPVPTAAQPMPPRTAESPKEGTPPKGEESKGAAPKSAEPKGAPPKGEVPKAASPKADDKKANPPPSKP